MRTNNILLLLSALLIVGLVSQCKLMRDDLSDCPQGIAFTFYSKTPCNEQISIKEVKNVEVQVYDAEGKFVQSIDESKVKFSEKGAVWSIPFDKVGTYTFTFWGKENKEAFTKKDKASIAYNIPSNPVTEDVPALFYGTQTHTFIDRSQLGTQIDTLAINLHPYKFNVHLTVKGLRPTVANQEYIVQIEDDNAAYDRKGAILSTPISYQRKGRYTNKLLKVDFTTLLISNKDLNSDGLRDGKTHILIKDSKGKLLFDQDLNEVFDAIKELNGGVDPELGCINQETGKVNDLNITLDVTTFERIVVIINDWNVVFRKDRL